MTAHPRGSRPVDNPDVVMDRHELTLLRLPAVTPARRVLDGRAVLLLGGTPALREDVRAAVVRYGGRIAAPGSQRCDVIIDLNVCGSPEPALAGSWHASMATTFETLVQVHDDWSAEADARRLYYVALTQLGGTMGLEVCEDARPLSGIWAGVAKTLPREFPACNVRVVDVGAGQGPGEAIVTDMFCDTLVEVGHADGVRYTIMPERVPARAGNDGLSPSDVVAFTGGSRGIGFEIALHLAEQHGCRVLVGGRRRIPGVEEAPWLDIDDDAFEEHARRLYVERDAGVSVKTVRGRVSRMRNARQVHQNLQRARSRGADVHYVACDVTDAGGVAGLVDAAGSNLACVVHNAGIDLPARLPKKSCREFIDVVATKVDGFLHLVEALQERQLKMLCGVGSMTGRFGGMPGQLDYAAGNEGLARLGAWASHRLPYSVKSLSWPTWEGLGLITNAEAAGRYMAPIKVPVGVQAWAAELNTPGAGEIVFIAQIREMMPSQARGFVLPSDTRDRERLLTARFRLGEPVAYRPGSSLDSVHRLDTDWLAFAGDAQVDGRAALPLSLALECLAGAAAWMTPADGTPVAPASLLQVRVSPDGLVLDGGGLTLLRRALGRWCGRAWHVHVQVLRSGDGEGLVVAEGTVEALPGRSRPEPLAIPSEGDDSAPGAGATPRPPPYRWPALVAQASPWDRASRPWRCEIAPLAAIDVSTLVVPPSVELPLACIEAAVAATPGAAADATVWACGATSWRPHEPARMLRFWPEGGVAAGITMTGEVVFTMTGARWQTPAQASSGAQRTCHTGT